MFIISEGNWRWVWGLNRDDYRMLRCPPLVNGALSNCDSSDEGMTLLSRTIQECHMPQRTPISHALIDKDTTHSGGRHYPTNSHCRERIVVHSSTT